MAFGKREVRQLVEGISKHALLQRARYLTLKKFANSLAGVGKSFLTFSPKQVVLTLDLLSLIFLRNYVPNNRMSALPAFILTTKVKKLKMIGASPLVFFGNWPLSYLK
jgi:hypothetical protein